MFLLFAIKNYNWRLLSDFTDSYSFIQESNAKFSDRRDKSSPAG